MVETRFVQWIPLVVMLAVACQKQDPEPAERPASAPAAPTEESTDEGDNETDPTPLPTHISLKALDRTSAEERPVDLSDQLQALAESGAKAAGFTIDPDGHQAGIEVFYALVNEGKPDPKTEKGTIAWAVSVGIRIVDEDGLGETFEGRRGDERPFVRGAIPDLKAGFKSVLADSIEGAFRDVAMQIAYQDADAVRCTAGLKAAHPEERWAAMRRLGELGSKGGQDSAQAILDTIDGADDLTVAIGVGVLGRLGDSVAIKPLAKLAEGPNPERAMLAITAIASIGGKEARKYLRLIGASHPSPVVQKMVEDLLAATDEAR